MESGPTIWVRLDLRCSRDLAQSERFFLHHPKYQTGVAYVSIAVNRRPLLILAQSPAVRLSESTLALSSPADNGTSASKRRKLAESVDQIIPFELPPAPLQTAFDAVACSTKENASPQPPIAAASPPRRRNRRVGITKVAPNSKTPTEQPALPSSPIPTCLTQVPMTSQKVPLRFSSLVKPTHYADREAAAAANQPPKRTRAERMSLLPQPGFMSRNVPRPFGDVLKLELVTQRAPVAPSTVAKSSSVAPRVSRFPSRQTKQKETPQKTVTQPVPAGGTVVAPSVGPSPVRVLRSRVIGKRDQNHVEAPAPTPNTTRKSSTTRTVSQAATVQRARPPVGPESSSSASTPPKSARGAMEAKSTVKKVPRTQLKPELRRARPDLRTTASPSFENSESLKLFEQQLDEAMRLGTASVGHIGASIRKTVEETQPAPLLSIEHIEPSAPKRRK